MEYIFRKKETKAQASSKNNGISNISTTKITNRRSNPIENPKEFFFLYIELVQRLSFVINGWIRREIFLNPSIIIRADESVQIALTFA